MDIKSLEIKSLEIKNKTNYDWDDIIYINDFDANSLEIIKENQELVLIFIILDMFLTQIMIIILQNLCILLLIV